MISRLDKTFISIFALFLLLFMTNGLLGQVVPVVDRYPSGNIRATYTTVDGKAEGPFATFFDNGVKRSEGTSVAGNWDGKMVMYHGNGKKAVDATFKAGRLTGKYTEYHVNGQPHIQGESYGSRYNSNETGHPLRTGLWTTYFDNGKKAFDNLYEKNELVGRSIAYHTNGKVYIDATFNKGRLTGTWSQYYETGQLMWQGTAYGNMYDLGSISDPLATGLWIRYNEQGAVIKAVVYDKNRVVSEASFSTDTTTGQTTIVATNPDGTRNVTKVDKNGIVGAAEPTKPTTTPAAKIDDAVDLIGMQTDPRTGQTTTSRRNPDGSTTTYTGTRQRDTDGTERLTEIDPNGNRIETSVKPDGTITEVRTRPGKGEKRTTTTPDGRVTRVERDVAGRTRTSTLAEDGSVVSTIRNSDGQVTGTTRQRPDGWVEQTDSKGNIRRTLRDASGTTTTITTDASGNVTASVVGKDGKVAGRDANIVAPREPGRTYYEQTLNGSNWDDLSPRLRGQMANSERQMQTSQVRRAEDDAAEARRKTEEARLAAQGANATEASKKRYEKMQAEKAEADRVAAALKAKFAKSNELEAAYNTGRTLDRDYRAAIERGDKKEAIRILALQDANAQKYATLLEQSPEERRAMEGYADARTKISNEINARAYAAAERTLASNAVVDNTRAVLTKPGQYVSMGAGVQQETAYATGLANREKVLAQARLQEIDRDLNDPTITPERRSILQDEREMAVLQENGANELLTSNSMVTAAGYTVDGVLMLSGAKLAQLGTNAVRGTATAIGGVLARRAAARAATTATTNTAGGIAGRSTVKLVDDFSANLGKQALLESRVSASLAEASQAAARVEVRGKVLEFTESELARLHRGFLTGPEIIKKADLYEAYETAKYVAKKAMEDGKPDAVVDALTAEFRRLKAMIDRAKMAADNMP